MLLFTVSWLSLLRLRLTSSPPLTSLVLQLNSERWFGGYQFSYEILIINALLTFIGLCLIRRK
jgi:hypothetical protein